MTRLYDSILITGMKHCGKSSSARKLSGYFPARFRDIDDEAELIYFEDTGSRLSSREIYKRGGRSLFQKYETKASVRLSKQGISTPIIAAAGGGICDNGSAVNILKKNFIFIFISEAPEVLYERIISGGIPAFLSADSPREDFLDLYEKRTAIYDKITDIKINADGRDVSAVTDEIIEKLMEGGHAG